MPRSPMMLPAGVTIADKLTLGNIARIFPPEQVKEALRQTGTHTKRVRELPNELIVYFGMLLGLYRNVSHSEVLRCAGESLHWLYGDTEFKITGKSGLSQARTRVGFAPFELLFRSSAKPLASNKTRGAYYRNWRLTAMDGSTFDVED
ncbi:MAG: transposase domain-containing protein, partial [Minisyncoccia bacterium]